MYTALDFIRSDQEVGSWSVKLQREEDEKIYWVDVWVNNQYHDVETDWNQYIFHLNNTDDKERREVQSDCMEFDESTSVAISYLEKNNELCQDNTGNWYCVISEKDWLTL